MPTTERPPPHILTVNGDRAVLDLVSDLLTEDGHRVTRHTYRDKDLGEIARLAPDLIILDYMWVDEDNGWSLLQMLKMNPKTEQIPLILCTAAVREVAALSGHLAELDIRVIFKPFNIDHLLNAITEVLGSRSPAFTASTAEAATSRP